jgi:hypothetical protein
VHEQVRKDGFTCEDSLAVGLGNVDRDQLLTQFRELAFYALYYAHDAQVNGQAVKAEADFERFVTEERLRNGLHSHIWRARQALKALIKGAT